MARKNIYDILNTTDIDLWREYARIHELFYKTQYTDGFMNFTLHDYIDENFERLNRRLIGRCISISDFDLSYGYNYTELLDHEDITVDYLVSFAEYVINFVWAVITCGDSYINQSQLDRFIENIKGCMDDIGYMDVFKDDIYFFIEKSAAAISVAEISEKAISYSVLEYNHHKLKGDLVAKKNILKNFADDIEKDRKDLNSINKSLTSDLFQLLNTFIRHDDSQNQFISNLSENELEEAYDEIYQMWLLAKLELEHNKKNTYISDLIVNSR